VIRWRPQLGAWLSQAPFDTVHIVVRYGSDTTDEVEVGRVNRRHSELLATVQVALSDLRAIQLDPVGLESVFREHVLRGCVKSQERRDFARRRSMRREAAE
jgi:hypothetical protein